MTKLFIDASAMMEIMLGRPKLEQVSKVLHNPQYEFFISSLTVHILYYFAEVNAIDRNFVGKLAAMAGHLPLTAAAVSRAQDRYAGKDFEDCLQAACAELGGCRRILTLDKHFERHSATKLVVDLL